MPVCLKPFTLEVVGSSPAAWWKMEENGGGDRIDVVNGIHMAVDTPLDAAVRGAGKILFGMRFNKAGSHFSLYATPKLPELGFTANNGFDLFGWLAVGVAGQTFFFGDYLIYDAGSGFVEEFYLQYATGALTVNSANFGTLIAIGFPSVPLNTYHLFRLYLDPNTNRVGIQIDNSTKTEAPYPGVLTDQPFGQMALEVATGAGDSIDISLDEYSIWLNGPPSDSVADQIYNGGAGTSFPFPP
jgi:hypothetical protein